jgi:hypothetical protein
MGRTPTPLTIAVAPEWLDRPELAALAAKGHRIVPIVVDADVVLHPRATWWCDDMWDTTLLDTLLRAARHRRRTKKEAD